MSRLPLYGKARAQAFKEGAFICAMVGVMFAGVIFLIVTMI